MWWRCMTRPVESACRQCTPTASAVRMIAETLCVLFTASMNTVRSGCRLSSAPFSFANRSGVMSRSVLVVVAVVAAEDYLEEAVEDVFENVLARVDGNFRGY